MGHSRQEGGFAEAPQPLIDDSTPFTGSLGPLRPEFVPLSSFTPVKPPKPPKSDGGRRLEIVSEFEPRGDQPTAIAELVSGVQQLERDQVLLGVTGSGKTFTMAKVIEATQRPP